MADSIDLIRRLEIANSQLIGSADNHKAITDAIRAISPAGGDWVMVPRDLLTHLGDWKVAVTAVYRNSQADLDSTEASYWKHQLETIIRIETMLAAAPQPQEGVKCNHEPYLGACVHCGCGFRDGVPVFTPPAHGDGGRP